MKMEKVVVTAGKRKLEGKWKLEPLQDLVVIPPSEETMAEIVAMLTKHIEDSKQ